MHDYERLNYDKEKLKKACKYVTKSSIFFYGKMLYLYYQLCINTVLYHVSCEVL